MSLRSPVVADWILARLVPANIRNIVLGDLREEFHIYKLMELGRFHAHVWYWYQLLSVVLKYSPINTPLLMLSAFRVRVLSAARRLQWCWAVAHDIRYSYRVLRSFSGFTIGAVCTLALAIGANAVTYNAVRAVYLSPLPYEHGEDLVVVGGRAPGLGTRELVASAPEYRRFKDRSESIGGLAATQSINVNATGGEYPVRLHAVLATPNLFNTIGAQPELGRDFRPSDVARDIGFVAIISHALWMSFFNGDPEAVGQTLQIDDDTLTVIGVMPEAFEHPGQSPTNPVNMWAPISVAEGTRFDDPRFRVLTLFGRLTNDHTVEEAQAECRLLAGELRDEHSAFYPAEAEWRLDVEPFLDHLVDGMQPTIIIMLMSAGLILLIACINLANLVLLRGKTRGSELALRSALGGTRLQLGRQLLIENVLLAATGGAIALLVAAAGTSVLKQMTAASIPRLQQVTIDGTLMVFTILITFLAVVVFGLVPSVYLSNQGVHSLLQQRLGAIGCSRPRIPNALVVPQIAVSLALLVGAGLMAKSFVLLNNVDPGFDSKHVIAMETWLPWPNEPSRGRYFPPYKRSALYEQALHEMESIPEVTSAGVVSRLPFRGLSGGSFLVEAGSELGDSKRATAELRAVSPSYFEVMRIHLHRGRYLEENDTAQNPPVAVVNDAFARRYFNGGNPLGARLSHGNLDGVGVEIVGVVGDVLHQGLDLAPRPTVYTSYKQHNQPNMTFVLRTVDQADHVARSATEALQRVDEDLPTFAIAPLKAVIADSMALRRLAFQAISVFAAMSVGLAALGVYGVIAHVARQRSHEIGVRIAMGAEPWKVLGLVLTHGLHLGVAGVLVGIPAAALLSRGLRRMLFQTDGLNLPVYCAAAAVALCAVVMASLAPAQHAARVDPLRTLKSDH